MKTDKRILCIRLLVIIGFILSLQLASIYYSANYDKYSLSSFCSINDFIDCDGVARSAFSQVFGIPLAYWGMFFYITVLFLTFVEKLKNLRYLRFLSVFKNPMSYITVLGTLAFAISMSLAGYSLFIIKKLCVLCVITYVIDFLLAIIAARNIKQYFMSFKETFVDFIEGIKVYPKTFVILFISTLIFLTYSSITDVFLPHVRKTKELRMYAKMDSNPYKTNGNILGNEHGDVVIDLYSDFVCPICYVQNIMLHRAAKEYSNIKVIHHNLPFDNECNSEIRMNAHPGACFFAKAALAAGRQGNYWGMASVLYEKHPSSKEDFKPFLKSLGLDEEKFFKDLYSEQLDKELKDEIFDINDKLGLDATPTIFINGEKKVGVVPYKDLQKLLEERGAKRVK